MQLFLAAAWPYASGPRHLGHLAGVYLPADIVARSSRLAGDEVLFVSGSDEFGTPITLGAEREGVPPQQFAERHHRGITQTFSAAGITFDHYTRTSTPTHARVVHDLFAGLHRKGLIVEGEQQSAWCPRHRRSLPDRYVEGKCPHCGARDARGDQCDGCGSALEAEELIEPRCRECGGTTELRPLRQLLLRLDLLAPRVAAWIDEARPAWRRWASHEAAGALEAGLRPRAITRDLPWGVPVPLAGWDDRRIYVWFEAVIGYVSATVEWASATGDAEGWRRWWAAEAVHRYFIGKDNLWFHALWWPAILSGSDSALHLPDELVASQNLTESGAALSTSRGRGTTIDEAIARWGVDPVRHALCAFAPETSDTELGSTAIEESTRTGLLGSIANPAHRVSTLWWQRFGAEPVPVDAAARTEAARVLSRVAEAFRKASLREGLAEVHALGRAVNQRLGADEPWSAPDDAARETLAAVTPLVDALALGAWPVTPGTAERIRTGLGRVPVPQSWALPPEPVVLQRPPERPLPR